MKLNVATEFSRKPGPRLISQGPYSGEEFRDTLLIPKLRQCISSNDTLEVVFDGCSGAGVSFLEESFGGLVRKGFSEEELKHLCVIWSSNPRKVSKIQEFIKNASDVETVY